MNNNIEDGLFDPAPPLIDFEEGLVEAAARPATKQKRPVLSPDASLRNKQAGVLVLRALVLLGGDTVEETGERLVDVLPGKLAAGLLRGIRRVDFLKREMAVEYAGDDDDGAAVKRQLRDGLESVLKHYLESGRDGSTCVPRC